MNKEHFEGFVSEMKDIAAALSEVVKMSEVYKLKWSLNAPSDDKCTPEQEDIVLPILHHIEDLTSRIA